MTDLLPYRPMKHAGPSAIAQLSSLLERLRQLPGLVERKPGIFYRRSGAFLHFHEDPSGLFADVKLDGASFQRCGVSSEEQQERLLRMVRDVLKVPD
ncbi:hypothetical protein OOT46_26090 [Aquabacterium sp. A7-Y]|uniref:hypothetical protein n=1 Tax=Aquabacterium sp. A7-Y TaxID=1349605 RepID=UPI00223C914B|nr:hypothetical protein [Aquabacterium sp. A7-Y]MCW7541285.1 hypothetical protein [Aquabacterium sp. A7-Y]